MKKVDAQKSIFAAIMANTQVTVKHAYKVAGKTPPNDEQLSAEIRKLHEEYYRSYDFGLEP